jgi:hypothetical protein
MQSGRLQTGIDTGGIPGETAKSKHRIKNVDWLRPSQVHYQIQPPRELLDGDCHRFTHLFVGCQFPVAERLLFRGEISSAKALK